MQWLLASLIHWLVHILETCFKKSHRFQTKNGNDPDFFSSHHQDDDNWNNDDNDNERQQQKLLQQAYKFMELEPPCDLEQVRKQYKRLSLLHHPDRNNGSPESQEMMQKLNACLDMIQKDLLKAAQDDDENEEEERQQAEAYEQARKHMEEELKREEEKYQQRKRDFHKVKQKDKSNCQLKQRELNLNSGSGRAQAQETFCQHMKQQEKQEKQEQQQQHQEKRNTPNSKTTKPNKPRNAVMDYNLDDIVVALRLGLPDIALGLMEEQINRHIQYQAREAYVAAQGRGATVNIAHLSLKWLKRPLDFDDNTLLHYAIYYEVYQVIRAICGMALQFNGLDVLLYQPNKYGQTPMLFAAMIQDESVQTLIQSQHDYVINHIWTKTRLVPALKSALQRLRDLGRNADMAATLSTLVSFGLGYNVLNLHWITSAVGVIYMQSMENLAVDDNTNGSQEDPVDPAVRDIADVTVLMSFFGTWILFRIIMETLIQYIRLEILLLLPTGFLLVGMVGAAWGNLGIEAVLFPLFVQSLVARYLERMLSVFHHKITPRVIVEQRLVKPFYLILLTGVSLLLIST